MRTLSLIHWANAYFPSQWYREVCYNVAESFNLLIVEERHLPITQLVDGVRVKMMRLIGNDKLKLTDENQLCAQSRRRIYLN